jgi:nucleotide-binding universal stress UspA family protein
MIKTILVPVTGTDADTAALTAALTAARRLGAHLDVLHVHTDPREIAAAFSTDVGGGLVSAGLIESLERDADQREEKAKKSFQAFCEKETLSVGTAPAKPDAVSVQWHREVGNESAWVGEYGRTSDLIVVARPEEGAARETLEAALLDTGRPLLIPGTQPLDAETIAIAWKSTREAARAVTAAEPFLAKAKRVVVITCAEHEGIDRDSATRLFATLQRHNAATEARDVPLAKRSAAEALLATASEVGAGLLVMGGYSHSRVRELVLGGVTAHVLRHAKLSVLMVH